MKKLVDIVNFNSDASCLSSSRWLSVLEGGKESELYRWAALYVKYERPVVLGFTGGTLADISAFNPETLELIDNNPGIFGAVVRPFSHDIHLLRRPASFRYNVTQGWAALRLALPHVKAGCYLPPEFMLSSEQVGILADLGLQAVFINPERFAPDRRAKIPRRPYKLRGLLGASIGCLPIDGSLTAQYLLAMQQYDAQSWNEAVLKSSSEPLLAWRDGESCFLIPDGIDREEHWLSTESRGISRALLDDIQVEFTNLGPSDGSVLTHYPVHSFSEWMKEFRMLGYLERIADYENEHIEGAPLQAALWLALINSDVLSAVEKRPVTVKLRRDAGSSEWYEYTLQRTAREFEAEEFMLLLGRLRDGEDVRHLVERSTEPHILKLRAREQMISSLSGLSGTVIAIDARR